MFIDSRIFNKKTVLEKTSKNDLRDILWDNSVEAHFQTMNLEGIRYFFILFFIRSLNSDEMCSEVSSAESVAGSSQCTQRYVQYMYSTYSSTHTLQYIHGNRVQYIKYSAVQCSTVQYSTIQYSAMQCSTVQYSTVRFFYILATSHFNLRPFPLTDTFSVISESDEQSHMDEVFEAFISSDNLDMKFEVKIGVNIFWKISPLPGH